MLKKVFFLLFFISQYSFSQFPPIFLVEEQVTNFGVCTGQKQVIYTIIDNLSDEHTIEGYTNGELTSSRVSNEKAVVISGLIPRVDYTIKIINIRGEKKVFNYRFTDLVPFNVDMVTWYDRSGILNIDFENLYGLAPFNVTVVNVFRLTNDPYNYVPAKYTLPLSTSLKEYEPGRYNITVADAQGCYKNYEAKSFPVSPTILNENEEFNFDSQLSDIEVNGDDLKWYDADPDPDPLTNNYSNVDRKTNDVLPINTKLVPGKSYWVTQTVNDVESKSTKVTPKFNLLSNPVFSNSNLKVYPNPTKDFIIVEDDQKIDSYQVVDVKGLVLAQGLPLSNKFTIDMSSFSSGNYLLKLKKRESQDIIKIVKN